MVQKIFKLIFSRHERTNADDIENETRPEEVGRRLAESRSTRAAEWLQRNNGGGTPEITDQCASAEYPGKW